MKSTLTKRGCQFKQSTGYRVSKKSPSNHFYVFLYPQERAKNSPSLLYIKIPLGRFESKERKCQTKQWSLLGM